MTTTIRITAAPPKSPDGLDKEDRARRGRLLPDHLHLDPHPRPLRPGEDQLNYIIGSGSDAGVLWVLPRSDRRAGRHGHRARAVSDCQAAEQVVALGFVTARVLEADDLRRRRQPAVARQLRQTSAAQPALMQLRSSPPASRWWPSTIRRSCSGRASCRASMHCCWARCSTDLASYPASSRWLGSSAPPCSSRPSPRLSSASGARPRRGSDRGLPGGAGSSRSASGWLSRASRRPHHRRNDRSRHRARLPRRHRLTPNIDPPRNRLLLDWRSQWITRPGHACGCWPCSCPSPPCSTSAPRHSAPKAPTRWRRTRPPPSSCWASRRSTRHRSTSRARARFSGWGRWPSRTRRSPRSPEAAVRPWPRSRR